MQLNFQVPIPLCEQKTANLLIYSPFPAVRLLDAHLNRSFVRVSHLFSVFLNALLSKKNRCATTRSDVHLRTRPSVWQIFSRQIKWPIFQSKCGCFLVVSSNLDLMKNSNESDNFGVQIGQHCWDYNRVKVDF